MATASSIISRAMRLIGVSASGETLSASEASDGLEALNAMLDSWRNERLMCYAIKDESLTLVASQGSYTIGTGGNLNTTRPVRIERAYIRAANNDYPVTLLNENEYALIIAKSTTSDWPQYAYYQPTMSTGTLYVWPVPNTGYVLHLLTWTPLASMALSDTVTLPPGYEEAMAYNLALRIAPEFGVQPAPLVVETAARSKEGIKRINSRQINAKLELPGLLIKRRSNIITSQ